MNIELVDRSLFVKKTVSVFVLSFLLIPLVSLKSDVPVLVYAGALVVLHIFVLIAYFYRVKVRELDSNARSLAARVVALIVVSYLLYVGSSFDDDASYVSLAIQMFAVSVLHTAILLLLTARIADRDAPTT